MKSPLAADAPADRLEVLKGLARCASPLLLLQRVTALIIALAVALPSIAGMEKESHSTRPGLFFAWLSPDDGNVLIYFDDTAQLRRLAGHCNAGRDVFSLQTGAKYKCRIEVFKNLAGEENWEAAGATVQGPSRKSDTRQFGLFSMNPPRTARWLTRRVSPQEIEALEVLLQSDARRFGTMKRQLKISTASVTSRPESSQSTVIVPGKVVRNDDAFYHAQRHHVFVKRGSAYSYLGEVPGKPTSFVDIDGNDLPGLVVTEGCDGWCISLWSLTGELQQTGTFGGH